MPINKSIVEMQLDGGVGCLDFINSAINTGEEIIVERLHTYNDLLILIERLALLNTATHTSIKKLASNNKKQAELALVESLKVREIMFKVFTTLANKQLDKLDKNFLKSFNDQISHALSNRVFAIKDGQLQMDWKTPPTLKQPVWAFLLSASDLLRDQDQHNIKQCGSCAWLFLDETKNHSRKWCDMQICGSNVKSKRYYQRKKMKNNSIK